ncbi:ribonuclease E/G [Clostridium tepidiprofundi]|uniref:ribonuclease E/G n=1 Tax=Clostridium tepidiprofundi TaxID=420412 RepID=UPI00082D2B5C|nr:ribonuclease E/G [Clostridium tepidiprofundi]
MKEIFLERNTLFSRLAIREYGVLKEIYIEENDNSPKVGEIYKGIVKNIVPAIKCAFVDIGYTKNCYLYMDKNFSNNIKTGQEIIVEVISEELGDKGAKVSTNFTIGGRYCVLGNFSKRIVFSKKILDKSFIYEMEQSLNIPKGISIVIRKNAEEKCINDINAEIKRLYCIYNNIINDSKHCIKPRLLLRNSNFYRSVEDEILLCDKCKIVVNDKDDYDYFNNLYYKNDNIDIIFHNESKNIFAYYGLEREILKATQSIVKLECGGYLVINKTEAMNVIDINSGANTDNNSINKTAYTTNLEAANEIVRQIKLRNLSGIIIIDFIDVKSRKLQNDIIEILRKGFLNDRSSVKILPFTQLNLVQIVRKRRGKSIYESIKEKYENSCVEGNRIKLSYMIFLIYNEIHSIIEEVSFNNVYIELNRVYMEGIRNNLDVLTEIAYKINGNIYINFTDINQYYTVKPLIFENDIRKEQYHKKLNQYILYKCI